MAILDHLISSDQLTPSVIETVFAAAEPMARIVAEKRRSPLLADNVVALIFLEPSSRTMLSFQAAAQRLGAGALMVHGKETSSVAKGESIEDTMMVVSGYADLIVARLPETGSAVRAAAASSVPFVNAGDGAAEHPTQSLIDLYTIQRELGTLEGHHVACGFDPLHSRTIHSLVKTLSQYPGTRFTFISAGDRRLPRDLRGLLDHRSVKFSETDSMAGLADADILYLNRLQAERFADQSAFDRHRHDYALLPEMVTERTKLILDPLPRVDEISPLVDALPQAAYFRQAHYGVPVRMALLALLLGKA